MLRHMPGLVAKASKPPDLMVDNWFNFPPFEQEKDKGPESKCQYLYPYSSPYSSNEGTTSTSVFAQANFLLRNPLLTILLPTDLSNDR